MEFSEPKPKSARYRMLIDTYIHRDTTAMGRILADEYTFINDDVGGVATKKQILDSFKSGGDREIISYRRQDDRVRVYGDVAVLTYRYQSQETYKGRENGGDFRVTRIFLRRDGRWQIIGGQETRVSSSEASVRARLIGSWKQVSDEETLPDGRVVRPDEIGFVTWDGTGHMSEQVMRHSTSQVPSDATYLRTL